MTAAGLDYPSLVQDALLGVVRRCLHRVSARGLPGAHHFYLGFRTDHPGVEIAERLLAEHPEEMTIVLQHEFWGLEVDDEAFEVSLRFQGEAQRLRVPFAALTSFVDPSAEFGLRFQVDREAEPAPRDPGPSRPVETGDKASGDASGAGRVVAFDPDRRR